MGSFLVGLERKLGKYVKMDREKKDLYREWCKENLKEVIDEWFYGKEYTFEDIVNEKQYIITYVAGRFLKWYIERNS